MKKLTDIFKKIWSLHASSRLVRQVSFVFVLLFAASMGYEALRTGPAFSFLWGAITTNTPVAVIVLYFLVGSALGFFRFQFVWTKNRFMILTSKQVEPRKRNLADDDSPADGEIEVIEDTESRTSGE